MLGRAVHLLFLKRCYVLPKCYQASRKFNNWDIVSAVCLERKPVISKELCDVERRYFELMQRLELEKSYLSDHEMRHIEDVKRAENVKKGIIEDADALSKQTAQDFEEASLKELQAFQPAPRKTEADSHNDQRSIYRKLDYSLLLVVKQTLGNDQRWILPQAIHVEGETLRQTAERALQTINSNQMSVQVLGNAPVGFYKYKYPKASRENGICGAKLFFFKAKLLTGNLSTESLKEKSLIHDFRWLLQSELKDFLQPVYLKAVESILLPDEDPENMDDSAQNSCKLERSVS